MTSTQTMQSNFPSDELRRAPVLDLQRLPIDGDGEDGLDETVWGTCGVSIICGKTT